MKCLRCDKDLGAAGVHNADYVIAEEFKVIEDGKEVQKTAIVCPDCYRETDFIIWGIHKT